MNLLVSGGTGLIGRALVDRLRKENHQVTLLSRSEAVEAPRILWDPERGLIDPRRLEGFDGVVHLAGESLASGRWTRLVKERILESRARGTGLLSQVLGQRERPPRVLVCASAVGFYGDRGEEVLTEESPPGQGFLPQVCQAWEAASAPARARGIRVAHLRFGVVLSRSGGALKKMLLPFQWGLGGPVGAGRQWWSWVSLSDAVGALVHVLGTEALGGPVNVTAPWPARNKELTQALARALHRPALFPLPAAAAKWVLGEMAQALLLASTRVEPRKLLAGGYIFRHASLESFFRDAVEWVRP